jgi:cytochrome c5
MNKHKGLVFSLMSVMLATFLVGCAPAVTTTITQTSPPATVTTPVTVTKPITITITATATQPPTSPTVKAGALAALGERVYETNCDVDYCHAAWTETKGSGTGGKAYFAVRNLAIFKTAQGYFTFIKYYMPNNFPGSVSDEQLLQVTAFMLTELGKVSPDALFGLGNLDTFTLE